MSNIKKAIETLEVMEQQMEDLREGKKEFIESLKAQGVNTKALMAAVKFKMLSNAKREQFLHNLNNTADYLNSVDVQLALFEPA